MEEECLEQRVHYVVRCLGSKTADDRNGKSHTLRVHAKSICGGISNDGAAGHVTRRMKGR